MPSRPSSPSTVHFAALVLVVSLGAGGCQKHAAEPFTAPAGVGGSSGDFVARLGTKGDFDRAAPNATASHGADSEAAPAADEGDRIAREVPRGLGTSFGEERSSSVIDSPFARGDSTPEALLSLFYNDLDGVRASAGRFGARANLESRVTTGDGLLAITLVDEGGRSLPAAEIEGRRYVIGNQGGAYRIGIENHSRDRFEVVGSVDGLDVIDGEQAALHKRGYILEPFSSVVIDGWRTSARTVAAFRFASIDDSYADRTGAPRDIGVIGVAFFGEHGAPIQRQTHNDDVGRRHDADPFPGRFAAPPRR
jgi:hypothetical protein